MERIEALGTQVSPLEAQLPTIDIQIKASMAQILLSCFTLSCKRHKCQGRLLKTAMGLQESHMRLKEGAWYLASSRKP